MGESRDRKMPVEREILMKKKRQGNNQLIRSQEFQSGGNPKSDKKFNGKLNRVTQYSVKQ